MNVMCSCPPPPNSSHGPGQCGSIAGRLARDGDGALVCADDRVQGDQELTKQIKIEIEI